MNRIRTLAALLGVAALAACGDKGPQQLTAPAPGGRVKFFNFGVGAPSVNFYANDTKMTGIQSTTGTESTLGTAFGSAAEGGFYSEIAPGQYTLSGRISAATDKDLAVASAPVTVADGKFYSFYMSGNYATATKQSDSFIVPDDFPATIDWTVALVRFVNAIANANPMTLYAKNQSTAVETAIGAAIPYKSAGAFVGIPAGTYTLMTRNAGSSANAITRVDVALAAGRVYTISSRGDITVTSTTAATRPQLDNTANR